MTPLQRAVELVVKWQHTAHEPPSLAERIERAIEDAVAEEREACLAACGAARRVFEEGRAAFEGYGNDQAVSQAVSRYGRRIEGVEAAAEAIRARGSS